MSDTPSPRATSTRLSSSWTLKQGIFLTVLLVFGAWGLADALYFYPRRGLEDASFKLRNYLAAAAEAGRLVPSQIAIPDLRAAHDELVPRMEELAKAASSTTLEAPRAKFDFAKAQWLQALARTWRLVPEPQVVVSPGDLPKDVFVDAATRTVKYDPIKGIGLVTSDGSAPTELAPQRLLNELVQKWNTGDQVKPLSGYDMPLQWVFVVLGFGGGAWMLLTMVRAASKTYRWEPGTQTLIMPGGKRIVPADVKEFDKRRWHKFFVTLHLKDGSSHTLDLLRYNPLEEWVLAMERTAFPESAAPREPSPEPVTVGNAADENPKN